MCSLLDGGAKGVSHREVIPEALFLDLFHDRSHRCNKLAHEEPRINMDPMVTPYNIQCIHNSIPRCTVHMMNGSLVKSGLHSILNVNIAFHLYQIFQGSRIITRNSATNMSQYKILHHFLYANIIIFNRCCVVKSWGKKTCVDMVASFRARPQPDIYQNPSILFIFIRLKTIIQSTSESCYDESHIGLVIFLRLQLNEQTTEYAKFCTLYCLHVYFDLQ